MPVFPLIAYEKNEQFKIYLNDVGLLIAMYGFEMKSAILKNTLIGPAKGGIFENLICDMLVKKNLKVNYFKTDNSEQEIEFLLQCEDGVIPIEVKSKNGATKSLNSYIEKFNPKYCYKFIDGNVGVVDNKITLPLYMAMFL